MESNKRLYVMTYLISYPRSGNTLFRYLFEVITDNIIQDSNPDIPDSAKEYYQVGPSTGKKVMLKSHNWSDDIKKDQKVNIVLRNYMNCMSSHIMRSPGLEWDTPHLIGDYADIILNFEKHPNKGSVIYYEDIINLKKQPKIMQRFFDTNGIKELNNWDYYLKNVEKVNEESKQGYTKIYGDVNKAYPPEIEAFKEKFKEYIGKDVYNKYLLRY